MDTSANSLLTILVATPAGKQISIAPASKWLRTAASTIYTLGLAIAVAVLFALWLTGKLVILVAALLVMAFDIPDSPTQMTVTKPAVSEPVASAPTLKAGFDSDRFQVADPW
jgi:hypothetical protein